MLYARGVRRGPAKFSQSVLSFLVLGSHYKVFRWQGLGNGKNKVSEKGRTPGG